MTVRGTTPPFTDLNPFENPENDWVDRYTMSHDPNSKFNLNISDGSTASYYQLPENAKELQDLISFKNMNAQLGEIFRTCYRNGEASHSDQLRDAKKIKFYIDAEIKRLMNDK